MNSAHFLKRIDESTSNLDTNFEDLETDVETINTTLQTTLSRNIAQVGGNTVSVGSGINGTGVQRMSIATDDAIHTSLGDIETDVQGVITELTTVQTNQDTMNTKLDTVNTNLGTINTSVGATQPRNISQWGGNAVTVGQGPVDGGTLRVSITSDDDLHTSLQAIEDLVALTNSYQIQTRDNVNTGNTKLDTINTNLGTLETDVETVNTTLSTTLSRNIAQVGGNAVSVGSGVNGTGVQRVSIATDDEIAENIKNIYQGAYMQKITSNFKLIWSAGFVSSGKNWQQRIKFWHNDFDESDFQVGDPGFNLRTTQNTDDIDCFWVVMCPVNLPVVVGHWHISHFSVASRYFGSGQNDTGKHKIEICNAMFYDYGAGANDAIDRWGFRFIDDQLGATSDRTVEIFREDGGGGSSENLVQQASWNIDVLDGTGVSGVNLQLASGGGTQWQLWLAHDANGCLLFGVNEDGRYYPCHCITLWSNQASGTSLHKLYGIRPMVVYQGDTEVSAGKLESAVAIRDMSCSVTYDLEKVIQNSNYSYDRGSVTAATPAGTETTLFTIYPRGTSGADTQYMGTAILKSLQVHSDQLVKILIVCDFGAQDPASVNKLSYTGAGASTMYEGIAIETAGSRDISPNVTGKVVHVEYVDGIANIDLTKCVPITALGNYGCGTPSGNKIDFSATSAWPQMTACIVAENVTGTATVVYSSLDWAYI